ncbi:MAG: hypothetical protein VSS75_026830 [Candidatus Parabeggiatoa sp.]|nr:hypothetical protein [Candidatus Parabeggiatoa sp.]
MYKLEHILPVARAIRKRIEQLLEPVVAEKVIYDLDKLITRAELGKAVADEIFELLNHYETTRKEMTARLAADESSSLANERESLIPSKYVCPVPGGCRCRRYPNGWERKRIEDEPPICPKLKRPLVAV